MRYITPRGCEKGLFIKLKDGHWASLSNGKKVQTDLLEPKFMELALKQGRLEGI
jgi:hypothetical protein